MYADLHIHSSYSDGTFTAEQIFAHARRAGISCIALTDHDNVDLYLKENVRGLCGKYAVEAIPGVELSASLNGIDIHLLGYGLDVRNERFLQKMREKKEFRRARLFRIAEKLNALGVQIDCEELKQLVGTASSSRLHLAQYLCSKKIVPGIRDAFERYLGKDAPAYIPSYLDNAETVIRLIKDAGGIVFIAHPIKYQFGEVQIRQLSDLGMDGIEVLYPGCPEPFVKKYSVIAASCRLLRSGGSDAHGEGREEVHIGAVKVPYEWVQEMKARISPDNLLP